MRPYRLGSECQVPLAGWDLRKQKQVDAIHEERCSILAARGLRTARTGSSKSREEFRAAKAWSVKGGDSLFVSAAQDPRRRGDSSPAVVSGEMKRAAGRAVPRGGASDAGD